VLVFVFLVVFLVLVLDPTFRGGGPPRGACALGAEDEDDCGVSFLPPDA